MRRVAISIGVCVLGAVVSAQRGGPPPMQPPMRPQPVQSAPLFRAGVDLVHLDVSVLDAQRQPVRGLVPADFTVLENGKPQTIAVFSAVDIRDPEPVSATWMRDVAPDVRSNEDIRERRLFLIIIDDAAIQADPFALKNVKEIAHKTIDRFGPSDLAAVIFTRDNRNSQDFTADRARLLASVDKFTVGFRDMGGSLGGPNDLYFGYSVGVMQKAVEVLATLPDRRKSIIYIGQGVPIDMEAVSAPLVLGVTGAGGVSAQSQSIAMSRLVQQMSDTFRIATRANVNVYTIDPCGLRTLGGRTCSPGLEIDYLYTVANATGAKAVLNTNNFDPGLTAIFSENASYYLLGYQSTDTRQDGKLRRLEVQVNRPGVIVRTRNAYEADKASAAAKKAQLAASPLGAALSGILPKGDLPMQLSAVPIALPGKKESAVGIVLAVRQPIRATGERTIEKVDLQVSAFNTNGKAMGSSRSLASVTMRAGASGLAEYEVVSRIDLKPGRYQLRIAANVGSLSTSGSLYYDIDVPDFSDEAISFSGLVVSATPSPPFAPKDGLKGVLPVIPTTRRVFSLGDQVSAFVRVYQGGKKPLGAVPVRVQIRSDHDVLVMDRREDLPAESFGSARAADVTVAVPIGRMPAGQYVLTIDSTIGKTSAHRDARFTIRPADDRR